jgi:AraC-like DNA-binding protein
MPLPLFPVGSLRRYLGEHAAHRHAHAQVLFGLHGSLELEVAGRAARVDASCGLVVPPGVLHAFTAPRGAQVWVIDAPAAPGLDRVRGFALPAGWSPGHGSADLLQWAGRAPRVLQRRRLGVDTLVAALAGALHQPWPNARMAALYALSVPQFHARWLALTGLAPQAWLRAQRLDAAQALLRAGLSLESTALQVGYASASALAYALRRERGLGARDLRGR